MGNDRKYAFLFGRVYRGIWGRFCLHGDPYTPVLRHKSLLGCDRSSDHVFWHPNTHCLWNFYFVWYWLPKNSKNSISMIDQNRDINIYVSDQNVNILKKFTFIKIFTFFHLFTVLTQCQLKFDISKLTSVWKLICCVRLKFSAYRLKYLRTYLLCIKTGNSLGMGKSL